MFGEKILDYWDDILKDWKPWWRPLVAEPTQGPHPFRGQLRQGP